MTKHLKFTNTKKWTQAWFRKLKPEYKLFWQYINEVSDHAGFWSVDIELAAICIGADLDEDELTKIFIDKVKVLTDDLWWIREHCVLQSKTFLKPDETSPPRKSTVDLLMQHDVYKDYVAFYFQTYPGLAKANDRLKEKVKDKVEAPVEDKDMLKDKLPVEEEDMGEVNPVIQSEYISSGDSNIQ